MSTYGTPGYPLVQSATGINPNAQSPVAVERTGEAALWSAFQYADGTNLTNARGEVFTTQVSQAGQGFGAMSIAETNMREAGRISSQLAFLVNGVANHVYAGVVGGVVPAIGLPDLANYQNNCVLFWKFIFTEIEIGPGVVIGAGGGIYGSTADTGDVQLSRVALNNGAGQVWLYREFPVVLNRALTFSMVQQWGANATVVHGGPSNASMIIRTMLLGKYLAQVVQG